jgi:glycosyltransferase involved in cell wall biosynthesis
MAIVSIAEVALGEADERLLGCNIEAPKPGLRTDGYEIDLTGWVLGRHSAAVAVEVVHEGSVARRAPVNVRRPDVAAAFAEAPRAERSGFRTRVGLTGMGELELVVQAVLRDQSRVPLGTIRTRRRWREGDYEVGAALVSVVIPCHDQAHFLGEAIESVLAQTYPHFEVVVVDDGSSDNTEEVASRYPGVRCVRQENQGLAAARNAGIRRSNGGYLVFLDADDRLLRGALEAGLRCFKDHPQSAFVAGRYQYIAFDGSAVSTPQPPRPEGDRYAALLRDNFINMHAVVMYQRAVFEYVRGFDTSLDACEDYDLYLRIARDFPIGCHDEIVAEYRKQDGDVARNSALISESTLIVLYAQRLYLRGSKQRRDAYNASVGFWQQCYGTSLLKEVRAHIRKKAWQQATRGLLLLLRHHPRGYASALLGYFSRTERLSQ